MQLVFVVWCTVWLTIAIRTVKSSEDMELARGIQILAPVENSIVLKVNDLKRILEADDIKDRFVVVVSLAGAVRQGKSYLLEFLVQYLNAQYKTHNVTDWMGEFKNESDIEGFKWRDDQIPETSGIWMWSEIFTHDFVNGEKVAIILLDAQGTLDSESNIHDYTSIFALNTILSSIQCYNLMNNIREDDLQLLNLFIEYGRQALERGEPKSFQYFLFIIRDWQYSNAINYGWHGQQVIDGIFNENRNHTAEMRRLRHKLQSSFQEIAAFLMPSPGYEIALGHNASESLQETEPLFRHYVKDLAPTILAPENLVIKRINGQKIRAQDFVQHLQTYLDTFNAKTLPEPETMFVTYASNQTLVECLSIYVDAMEDWLKEDQTIYSDSELEELHTKAKNDSIRQCLAKSKLRDELLLILKGEVGHILKKKYHSFKEKNEARVNQIIENIHFHNGKLVKEIKTVFETTVRNGIGDSFLGEEAFIGLFHGALKHALHEFDLKKIGHERILMHFRDGLEKDLKGLEHIFRHKNQSNKPLKARSKWRQRWHDLWH